VFFAYRNKKKQEETTRGLVDNLSQKNEKSRLFSVAQDCNKKRFLVNEGMAVFWIPSF